jgi:transcriptional regulator with XRE-family HTH domain
MSEYHPTPIDGVLYFWRRRPPELQKLEKLSEQLKSHPETLNHNEWLHDLRTGLHISAAALAEKLQVTRQAISQFEENERHGNISINRLRTYAEKLDCHFVYGFIPKKHPSFAHQIVQNSLPYVDDKSIQHVPPTHHLKVLALYSRMMSLLGHKTGWDQIWGYKAALKRKSFNWFTSKRKLKGYHSR